jgi:uncharacterized membrane protein
MLLRFKREEAEHPLLLPGGHAAGGATERPIRSLSKAVSWRVTGSLDTILLSWLFTGDLGVAAAIGFTEVVTKMVLYYAHERVWARIGFGRSKCAVSEPGAAIEEKAPATFAAEKAI